MNANLEKVLRVLKSRGLFETTNNAELARLSGVSRQWVSRNSGAIQTYLSSAPQPSIADCEYVDKRLLETYVQEAYKQAREENDGFVFSLILGAVTGFVLRQETDLINDVQRLPKIIKVGTAVIKLIAQIQTRKDDTGVPIHSKSKQAQYLLTEMNRVTFMDHLFKRADSYSTGGEGNTALCKVMEFETESSRNLSQSGRVDSAHHKRRSSQREGYSYPCTYAILHMFRYKCNH